MTGMLSHAATGSPQWSQWERPVAQDSPVPACGRRRRRRSCRCASPKQRRKMAGTSTGMAEADEPSGGRPGRDLGVDRLALHAPGRLDRIEELRRRDVLEPVVVVVVLARSRGAPTMPTGPRNFCEIAPFTVSVPSVAPQL